jgi:uncharacterized protein (DUF1697 family)
MPVAPRKTAPVMHVALLRGINVGKAKRVAMAELRTLCEALGYGDVRTLLNSGNLVFSAPRADARAAAKIEKEIASRLGIDSRVLVITGSELDAIVAENPFAECETNASRLLVTVLATTANRARIEQLTKQSWGAERLGFGSRAAYVWCPEGILESKASVALGKVLGDAGTSRNWATMKKLQVLMHTDGTARA